MVPKKPFYQTSLEKPTSGWKD